MGIDIEDASQRPAWYREADCYRNGFRIIENDWNYTNSEIEIITGLNIYFITFKTIQQLEIGESHR